MVNGYKPWSWELFCKEVNHGDLVKIVVDGGNVVGYVKRGLTDVLGDYDKEQKAFPLAETDEEKIPMFDLQMHDPTGSYKGLFDDTPPTTIGEDGYLEVELVAGIQIVGYEVLKKAEK